MYVLSSVQVARYHNTTVFIRRLVCVSACVDLHPILKYLESTTVENFTTLLIWLHAWASAENFREGAKPATPKKSTIFWARQRRKRKLLRFFRDVLDQF